MSDKLRHDYACVYYCPLTLGFTADVAEHNSQEEECPLSTEL